MCSVKRWSYVKDYNLLRMTVQCTGSSAYKNGMSVAWPLDVGNMNLISVVTVSQISYGLFA